MKSKKSPKAQHFSLAFWASVVVIFAVYIIWFSYVHSPQYSPVATVNPVVSTQNWKTYADINFKFMYPTQGYDFNKSNNSILISLQNYPQKGDVVGPTIMIRWGTLNVTSEKYVSNQIKSCQPGMGCRLISNENIGNNNFTKYIGPSAVVGDLCYLASSKDKRTYVEFCDRAFNNSALRDQILSTFKFTK